MPAIALALLVLAAPPSSSGNKLNRGARQVHVAVEATEEDVRRLVADWAAFGDALAAVAPPEAGSVEAAEAAWAADDRVREALLARGTSPDEFLERYRRVANGWWALLESEARAASMRSLEREIDALSAADDPTVAPVIEELERGLASLKKAPAPDEAALDVIRAHRSELARVFAPKS